MGAITLTPDQVSIQKEELQKIQEAALLENSVVNAVGLQPEAAEYAVQVSESYGEESGITISRATATSEDAMLVAFEIAAEEGSFTIGTVETAEQAVGEAEVPPAVSTPAGFDSGGILPDVSDPIPTGVVGMFGEASIYEHQPLHVFSGLSAERASWSVEDQQNPPMDASNKNIRHLSPFTISLLPPKEVGAATASDPYSWTGLGNLSVKTQALMGMANPTATTSFWTPGSDAKSAADRAAADIGFKAVISNLEMMVYNGQITSATEGTLSNDLAGVQDTIPLFGQANVADIYMQLIQMMRTPPLILLINPTSMNVTYAKIQSFQERTRYGYIYQAWGEQLPTINFSGRIGAYYGGESPSALTGPAVSGSLATSSGFGDSATTHPSGVQEACRRVSPAYQNLMNLFMLYRNNGYIRDTVGGSQANWMIGMVEIAYDGVRYIGQFDKLEWTFEEANNLGGVNFSFDFTATEIRHTDERSNSVLRMNNPNNGSRFGDDPNEIRTMASFIQSVQNQGQEGGDAFFNVQTSEGAQDSWNAQVGLDGWGANTGVDPPHSLPLAGAFKVFRQPPKTTKRVGGTALFQATITKSLRVP